jgi:hypothetical protein
MQIGAPTAAQGKKRQRPKYRTWQIRQFLLKTGQKSVKNGQNRPIL